MMSQRDGGCKERYGSHCRGIAFEMMGALSKTRVMRARRRTCIVVDSTIGR